MSIIEKVLGENKSNEFLNKIPEIGVKQFIFKIVKVVFLSLLVFALAFVSIYGLTNLFGIKLTEEQQSLLVVPFIYLPLVFFTRRNFFKETDDLKRQYTSLKYSTVLKHVFFISIVFYPILFVWSVINLASNPAEVQNALTYFENQSNANAVFNPVIDVIFFLSLWLLVGIAEELFFRGAVYRNLRKFSNRYVALIIASLFFVLPHAPSDLFGFISIFSVSIIYALYYEYKNNLLTITILHFVHDLLGAGLLIYAAAYTVRALSL